MHDDEVARVHWPCHAELYVNRYIQSVPPRSFESKMGRSDRDREAWIAPFCREGTNRIYIACMDDRKFSIMVRPFVGYQGGAAG